MGIRPAVAAVIAGSCLLAFAQEPGAPAAARPDRGAPAWAGEWAGRATQAQATPYDVELGLWFMVPGRVGGISHYPQLGCSGTLTLQTADANRLRYVERIAGGGNCVSGGAVEVVLNAAGELEWTWFYPGGNPGAQAKLARAPLSADAQRHMAAQRSGVPAVAVAPPATPMPAGSATAGAAGTAGTAGTASTAVPAATAPATGRPAAKPAASAPLALGLVASLEEDIQSLSIDLMNTGCSLRQCDADCAADAPACPGGPKAALRRGVWAGCSLGDWSSNNCRILSRQIGGEWSQKRPVAAPAAFGELVESLRLGQAFAPTRQNQAFVAGLGSYLAETCQLLAGEDEVTIRSYAAAGMMASMQRDDRATLQGNLQATLTHGQAVNLGAELGRQLACRLPESYLLGRRLAASIRAGERGTRATGAAAGGTGGTGGPAEPSVFVRTCSSQHGQRACECLAGIGRASLPDVHARTYSRDLVAEIIRRNPVMGLGVSMQCGITRY